MQELGAHDLVAVVERAGGRAEVFEHWLAFVVIDAEVQLGDERVVIDRERAAWIEAEGDLSVHRYGGATPCARFEDHQSPDATGAALLRLARLLGWPLLP